MNTITLINKYASSVGLWLIIWFLAYTTVDNIGWSVLIATMSYLVLRSVFKRSEQRQTRTFERKLRGARLRNEEELYTEEKRRWDQLGRDRAADDKNIDKK
ncbi:MAG: hypothetical protein JJU47_05770 [Exiguobacterium sp.]|uniref:hypothetical protein n=1 Tax=Exiguobacterium sp. ZOR0005 TaxID=1339226 RepID=UPI000647DB67|nr:hypothetical protein [Exiguobacterium sp. ZOR0005]MCC5892103.1 hypothetical protein [Exiguobacterium sp.]